MVNKLYFTALLLGHGTAAPVVSNGVMQARDDDVARAASLHEGYSALVEPRLSDRSGYGGGDKGYNDAEYGHKKGDDYGYGKDDKYGHKDGNNYGHNKGDKYDHRTGDDYSHGGGQ